MEPDQPQLRAVRPRLKKIQTFFRFCLENEKTVVSLRHQTNKNTHTMSQQELNQLHGLLTTFKRTMITEDHTMEDLHAVLNTAFIVSETKPNA